MHKARLVLAGIVCAVALVAAGAPPASAAEAGVVVFTGSANVPGGLFSPASTHPDCTPVCPRNSRAWNFDGSGVGAAARTDAGNPATAGGISISGNGSLEGWCGQSFGSGGGNIVDAQGQNYGFSISWVSGATLLILTGTATKGSESGPIVTVVDAVPTGGSCLEGQGDGFTIVGAGAYVIA